MRFALGVWAEPQARSVLVGVFRPRPATSARPRSCGACSSARCCPPCVAWASTSRSSALRLAWSQLIGLFLGRYLLRVTPLVTVSDEDLVTVMAPILQRIVTDPLAPAA